MLSREWDTLDQKRGDLITRCEQYARWTIPSLCPTAGYEDQGQPTSMVEIGADLVNGLANHIANVMFPAGRCFFTLDLSSEAKMDLRSQVGADKLSDAMEEIRAGMVFFEGMALDLLNVPIYRPKAVECIQHAIVCGGCILKRVDDNTRIVYGVKNFVVRRRKNGSIFKLILRDVMTWDQVDPEDQAAIMAQTNRDYKDDDSITLYTMYVSKGKKYICEQGYDDVMIGKPISYAEKDVPFIDIPWSLQSGDDYARGLVESSQIAFNALDKVTEAELDIIAIATDIKNFISPDSGVDPAELMNSPRGSWHVGKSDAWTVAQQVKLGDYQLLTDKRERLERHLSKVFLSASNGVRDAERVDIIALVKFY